MRGLAVVTLLTACGRFGFSGSDAASDSAIDAPDRPNRIFMSAMTQAANLGGLVGADTICQQAADTAGLGGTFVALLWTATDDVASRVGSSRGWIDLTGTPIADQPTDLNAASIFPLQVDELGQRMAGYAYAWWGGPASVSGTCTDWTSTTTVSQPLAVENDASFHTDGYINCDNAAHLICAEIGHVAPVEPPAETGRIVFITEQPWQPGGGVASADAICNAEAGDAGLPGTFAAFLPTATATAESRFSTAGPPWRRADGPRITNTADELVGASPVPIWKTFISRTARGQETNARAWTGTMAENCTSWTSTATVGTLARTHTTRRQQLNFDTGVGCLASHALICLEQ